MHHYWLYSGTDKTGIFKLSWPVKEMSQIWSNIFRLPLLEICCCKSVAAHKLSLLTYLRWPQPCSPTSCQSQSRCNSGQSPCHPENDNSSFRNICVGTVVIWGMSYLSVPHARLKKKVVFLNLSLFNAEQFTVPVMLSTNSLSVSATALFDSGAAGNLIDCKLDEQLGENFLNLNTPLKHRPWTKI